VSGGAGLALVLRLDEAAAARVRAAAGDLPGGPPPWPPHLTLALLDPAAPEPPLRDLAIRLAAAWAPLTVTLASLGVFPGPWLFLAPVPGEALLERHRALLAALPPDLAPRLHPHSRRGCWVPHVTLGATAAVPGGLLRALPLTATLDRIELIRFPPPRALLAAPLAPAPNPSA
jgi:2'-5' RNA ligase